MKRFILFAALLTCAALCAAQTPAPENPKPCLIVKHIGSFSGRFFLAPLFNPKTRYAHVDSFGLRSSNMTYNGRDLELLQAAGTKVVVLQDKYSEAELEAARASCQPPPAE